MRIPDDIYGPGPIPGTRVLLATSRVDYEQADLAGIEAEAVRMGGVLDGDGELVPVLAEDDADDIEDIEFTDGEPDGDDQEPNGDEPDGDDDAEDDDEDEKGTDDRAALDARAEALGIPVQANWKDETVAAKIAEAEAAAQGSPDTED